MTNPGLPTSYAERDEKHSPIPRSVNPIPPSYRSFLNIR
jgi:hypothetical protein